jgi:hypothetical protein
MAAATMVSLPPPSMTTTATLALPQTRIGRHGEAAPRCVSFIVATVVVAGTIFVSICGMMAPKTMATATDEAILPITVAGKRWDTTTPSAWSNKNKHQNKHKNKFNNSGSNIMASLPEDS